MTAEIRETRQSRNWEEAIGAKVRETMASAEMARYFNVKMTPKRARVTLLQLEPFCSIPARLLGQSDRQLRCGAGPAALDGARIRRAGRRRIQLQGTL
jgi:hypothetical protein